MGTSGVLALGLVSEHAALALLMTGKSSRQALLLDISYGK